MNKKQIYFSSIFLLACSNIFCTSNQPLWTNKIGEKHSHKKSGKFFLGPAIAIFHSQDNLYKEIHQQETLTPMIQLQYDIASNFVIWSDLGFFYNDGNVESVNPIYADKKATIYHLFGGLGLKIQYPFNNKANIFFKVGPSLMYVHVNHNVPGIKKNIDELEVGLTVGGGLQALIKRNWYVSIFTDYMYNRKTIAHPTHPKKIDLGGFLTGIGINYKF